MENMMMQFKQPILFDGETITECDLSGIRKLTTADIYAAQLQNGLSLTTSHMEGENLRYAMTVAAMATGRPRGFFGQLKKRDVMAFPRTVNTILNDEVADNVTTTGKKLEFKKNIEGLGRKLNLSEIDNLVADDFAMAQDEIGIEESTSISDFMSIKYACVLASILTGKKLEDFMKAPTYVGLTVRGVVMNYFFEPGSETDDGSTESDSANS